MKKKITFLALLTLLVATTTFASDIEENLNRKISAEFSRKFADAKEVTWSRTDKYVKASFKLYEEVTFAYYNESGELIGISRNILRSQLPINLQGQLLKKCGDGWITELFEFAREDQSEYFVTVENADQKLFLKSEGNSWTVYKRIKKF